MVAVGRQCSASDAFAARTREIRETFIFPLAAPKVRGYTHIYALPAGRASSLGSSAKGEIGAFDASSLR